MNITRGKIPGAVKVVVYGPEGIGKSTFASQFPGAVFCDTEGSTIHMDVARFDKPEKWMDIHAALDWSIAHPDQVGTFVLDTADWAEKLGTRYVCQEEADKSGNTRNWDNIEAPGYGKGYTYLKAAFQTLLDKMSVLAGKGVNVVITAHAILKKFEQPDEMGSYDRWSLKLNEKNVSPLVKEWADMVLFVNYRTDVVKSQDGKTNKARGGQKRVMYTQHNACWDAKNRFGLPDEIPFEFSQIAHLFQDRPPVAEVNEPEPVKEPIQITPPKAEVTTSATMPPMEGIGAKKRKPKEKPAERPEMMRHEDPAKDKLLETVWNNLMEAGITDAACLQSVVANRGYYEMSVPIKDYDTDFIEGCLIDAWGTVKDLCLTAFHNLPF